MLRWSLFPFFLALQGCLVHWVTDTSVRLQLQNKTLGIISELQIIPLDTTQLPLTWIPDTIPSNGHSLVYEKQLVGEFHFRIHYSPNGCLEESCFHWQDLGVQELEGGSIVWFVTDSLGTVVVHRK